MLKPIQKSSRCLMVCLFSILSGMGLYGQEIFKKAPAGAETRWISPENPTGQKGMGGTVNKGAKGNAYFIIAPGEKKIIMDVRGAGIIKRIWMSGTAALNPEQRRSVRIDMFWDNAMKPAVSAPIGDFFGVGLGQGASFESNLFSSPEGRSFNCTTPMPYRTAARMEITNESPSYVLLWYDINYITLKKPDNDAMYFHAYWSRNPKTILGRDFELLPLVNGTGRYLGANIGLIGNSAYKGTWFGEGEVKIFLDGDKARPTLVGTGTEDYIGSGWGQGVFHGSYHGSLISDDTNDIYAFYRYHIADPVYFNKDCRVTIQQMGNAGREKILEMKANSVSMQPVDILDLKGAADVTNIQGNAPEHIRLLDLPGAAKLDSMNIPSGAALNYLRSEDDISSTAYFYLTKPVSNLPQLPPVALRMKDLKKRVFDKLRK